MAPDRHQNALDEGLLGYSSRPLSHFSGRWYQASNPIVNSTVGRYPAYVMLLLTDTERNQIVVKILQVHNVLYIMLAYQPIPAGE